MKKRHLLLTAIALGGAALLLNACAPVNQTPRPDGYTLRPALSGERRTLTLPGYGKVNYYASQREASQTESSQSSTARPLILTHSVNAAASAYEMKPLWDAYAGSRPVYALEWPGFGSSERLDVTYTSTLMASALSALVAELGTDVDVVSLSLGSEFSARAALQEGRIKSLALISPSGLGSPRGGTQQATENDRGVKLYNTLNAIGDPLYGTLRTRPSIQYFLSRSFRGPVDQGLIDYAVDTSRQPGAKYAPLYFVSGRLFEPDAYVTLYDKLSIPTLVVYDQDAFVSFDRLPLLAQKSNVSLVRIEGTDGLPHFEKMNDVKSALDIFWAGLK